MYALVVVVVIIIVLAAGYFDSCVRDRPAKYYKEETNGTY